MQVPAVLKAEVQQQLLAGVPISTILLREWEARLSGDRKVDKCPAARTLTYSDIKRLKVKRRPAGDPEALLEQSREDWVQRLDPTGLGLEKLKGEGPPAEKIRSYGQATVICYSSESISLLAKYNTTIVLDATHGLVNTNYSTIFLVVIDDRGVGKLPVRSCSIGALVLRLSFQVNPAAAHSRGRRILPLTAPFSPPQSRRS